MKEKLSLIYLNIYLNSLSYEKLVYRQQLKDDD